MSNQKDTMRSFFAVELPDNIKGWVNNDVIKRLSKLPVKAKWVDSKNMHLTLRFLGNIDYKQFEKLLLKTPKVLEGIGIIELKLSKIGTFGGQSLRVVWISVDGEIDKLSLVYKGIEDVCMSIELKSDNHKYSPHITIGRIKSQVNTGKLVSEIKKIVVNPLRFCGEKITLFRSTLTPQGPIYEILEKFSL